MERLTFEGKFCDIAQCTSVPGGSYCEKGSCSQRKVWERLKAYEDTGLTPEEIGRVVDAYGRGQTLRTENALRLGMVRDIRTDRLRELAEADKEGRVRIIPEGVTGTCGSCENFEMIPGSW